VLRNAEINKENNAESNAENSTENNATDLCRGHPPHQGTAPAAAWLAFGPAGMLLMGLIWAVPIVAGGRSRVQITARISLTVYMLVALVEGAFVLVPTQAVYWFVAALALAPADKVLLADEKVIESESDTATDRPHHRRAA